MERNTKFHLGLLLCTALGMGQSFAVDSLGTALGTAALDAVLDPVTGNFYVGTTAGAGNTPIAKLTRPTAAGTSLTATNINAAVPSANLTDLGISNMAIANASGVPRIACISTAFANRITVVQDTSGTIIAGRMADEVKDGAAADGFVVGNLTMSPNLVFAAVSPTNATSWLATSSLIAVHIINGTTMIPAAAAATVAAEDENAAGNFAITTAQVDATSGDSPVLHWDNYLERLYVGTQLQCTAVAGNGSRSVAVYTVDSLTAPAALAVQAIKTNPTAGWGTGAAAATQNIIGVGGAATGGYSAVTPNAAGLRTNMYDLKTMLTQNGHSYLIMHASQAAAATEAKGNIYAFPLVTKGYTNQGSLAKVDSVDFSIVADNPATDLYNGASVPAIVGTGALPIAATGTAIVKLQVVGHTVYATVSRAEAALNEPGLFYSQALFDHNGKIKEWTRWEKAAPSTLGATAIDADLFRSAVDLVSGRVWGVAGGGAGVGGTQVRTTTWTKSTTTSELAQAVNAQLTTGCYSMLAVGRSTSNYGSVSLGTLAAFGGIGKVCFAMTGAKTAAYLGQLTSQILASYAAGNNFAVTTLPNANEKVNCLGYSRGLTGAARGYFLAGTDSGLYIFTTAADAGGNPAADDLDDLDAAYFLNTSVWKELTGTAGTAGITKVTGSVKKILARGHGTAANGFFYVLAQDTGTDGNIRDTLYRVEIEITSAAMKIEIVAQSGVDGTQSKLANAGRFLDFVIVQGGTGAAGEEIILVTQAGLFQSRVLGAGGDAAEGVAGAAADTAEELWWAEVGQKPGNTYTASLPFAFAYAPQTAANLTSFTTIHHVDGSDARLQKFGYNAFNRWGTNGTTFNDAQNTANVGLQVRKISAAMQNTSSTSTFLRLNRIMHYWSDGARRFLITKPADGSDTESLVSLPYRVGSTEWNLTDPVTEITNTVVDGVTHFNCIEMLPHGVLAVGTDTGIITLE